MLVIYEGVAHGVAACLYLPTENMSSEWLHLSLDAAPAIHYGALESYNYDPSTEIKWNDVFLIWEERIFIKNKFKNFLHKV